MEIKLEYPWLPLKHIGIVQHMGRSAQWVSSSHLQGCPPHAQFQGIYHLICMKSYYWSKLKLVFIT